MNARLAENWLAVAQNARVVVFWKLVEIPLSNEILTVLQAVSAGDLRDIMEIVLRLEELVDVFKTAFIVALILNGLLIQDSVVRGILLREQIELRLIILIILARNAISLILEVLFPLEALLLLADVSNESLPINNSIINIGIFLEEVVPLYCHLLDLVLANS